MKYADEKNIPVVFDFNSFENEYRVLGYSSVEEYLFALYELLNPVSDIEENLLKININSGADFRKPGYYRQGLNYDDELLKGYEDLIICMEERELPIELSLEDFVDGYTKSEFKSVADYCDSLHEKIVNNTKASGGNSGYYYNIGTSLTVAPDYSGYYIQENIQRGDIILDNSGSLGVWGHAAIVEGNFYDSEYGYYVRLIESVGDGVCRGLLDDVRADERESYLYRVKDATDQQKAAAVEFCISQIGKSWSLNLSHSYSSGTPSWLCSQLVWAGYKNQGIDIECNGGSGGDVGVTPKDITVNSTKVMEMDFRTTTGWKYIGGSWYFYGPDGPLTGWQYLFDAGSGDWYFFDANGKMQTGWKYLYDGGYSSWYYFSTTVPRGKLLIGWQYLEYNGVYNWYYFSTTIPRGKMQIGWQYLSYNGESNWYYFRTADGVPSTGAAGSMCTGWQTIGGVQYYFNSSGAWVS